MNNLIIHIPFGASVVAVVAHVCLRDGLGDLLNSTFTRPGF